MSNKITLNTINTAFEEKFNKVQIKLTDDLTIELDPNLTLNEKSEIVDEIAGRVMLNNTYIPEYFDVVLFTKIIEKMSNFPVPKKKYKTEQDGKEVTIDIIDFAKAYTWMRKSNLIDKILNPEVNTIESEELKDIVVDIIDCAEKQISYQKEVQKKVVDNLIKEIEDKFTELQNIFTPENMELLNSVYKDTVGRNIDNEEIVSILKDIKVNENKVE